MSAFIVSEQTMHRVVAAVIDHMRGIPAFRDRDALGTTADPAEIGRKLYAMNSAAVSDRYNEPAELVPYDRYEYPFPTVDMHVNELACNAALYKAVSCYLYQCAEGSIPDRPLYKAMQTLQHRLADRIISRLPEYQAAPWDAQD